MGVGRLLQTVKVCARARVQAPSTEDDRVLSKPTQLGEGSAMIRCRNMETSMETLKLSVFDIEFHDSAWVLMHMHPSGLVTSPCPEGRGLHFCNALVHQFA